MKHIVDGLGYQEACNGIKCIDCPFLDNEHNCKIEMYIRSQKVYQERPHGEWIVNLDNGVKFGTIDLKCPKCGHCVICPKVDIPNFCGKCGADMRPKEGEAE